MDKTSLGDRMKFYESRSTDDVLMPMIPVMARMDGRSFSKFTKNMERPYDTRLSGLMIRTTQYLVEETNARCGYTQSDEITLVWLQDKPESDIFFSGKLFKMTSILASMTSVYFNNNIGDLWKHINPDRPPVFDARVWNVPLEYEACNAFIWREMDATRNSVQMAARSMYSHKELHGKNNSELQEMMFQKGTNWNNYSNSFKRGTYIRRCPMEKTTDEGVKYTRNVTRVEHVFPQLKKIANREDVIFRGADTEMKPDD